MRSRLLRLFEVSMLNRSIVLFVMFLSATALVASQSRPEPAPARKPFERFPSQVQTWRGELLPPLDSKILAVLGADDILNRVYFAPDRSAVALYIGFYNSQRQGDSIHSPMNCLPGAGWEPISRSHVAIPVAMRDGTTTIDANRYVIQKGINRQLVLYWYQSHGRTVASEYWSKLYLISDAVRLNRTDAALVRVIVPIDPRADDGETIAQRQAGEFVRALFPLLPDYLPS
jgi:EpsI family protein